MPARAAAQPALASYRWDDDEQAYVPMAIQVLWLRDGRISEIDGFVSRRTSRSTDCPRGLDR